MLAAANTVGVAAKDGAPSKSAPVAQALAQRLEQAKLQYLAVRDPGEEGRYVAVMHLPKVQFVVISAKYSAPPLIQEKLIQGKYQDVFVELNSASDRNSRIIVEDLRADGLPRAKSKEYGADKFEAIGKGILDFDFDWRKAKLTREDYMKAVDAADEQYARMLTLLLEQAKK